MIIDGLFIYHLIEELNQHLTQARLERIYQTSDQSFLFVFYRQGKRLHVKLSLDPQNFGLFITEKPSPERIQSQFFLTLKKHLEGAILNGITQHETDRVMILSFTVYDFIDGPKPITLIFELMGRYSNLILVKDQILLDSFKKMFFDEGRQLIPGATFAFFPSQKKPFTTMQQDDLVDPKSILDQFMGISPALASYLDRMKVLPLQIPLNPVMALDLNRGYLADIFLESAQKITYPSLSKLLDDAKVTPSKKTSSHALFIQKQTQKHEKKLAMLELALEHSEAMLIAKEDADAIYASLIPLDQKRSSITVGEKEMILDPTKTLNENAQMRYGTYHKMKRAIAHQSEQLERVRDQLSHLMSLETYLSISSPEQIIDLEDELKFYGYEPQKRNPKKKVLKPLYSKVEAGGATYYIGKNSKQNAYLIHELARRDDVWFHVKDAAGAHVVVQCDALTEPIIRLASQFAAYYSDLKYSQSIPVDYTRIRHLKKIPKKPGFNVTYQSYQTMFIDIDDAFISAYGQI